MSYNGWTNYETWNVALWIQNDENLYDRAKNYSTYELFCTDYAALLGECTPDDVRYDAPELNIYELDQMLKELT